MKNEFRFRDIALVAAATVLPLLFFLDKAVHIDDPLFLWTARQILAEPFNFFGYTGNWFGELTPATEFMTNPPLSSYYIAAVALFAGFTERALHAAFLAPAVFAALGTYVLASRLTSLPVAAALAAIASPAFFVSSTTLMCDVMMLAFWVWAIVFWKRGVDEDRAAFLAAGGALVTFSALTKFIGVSLIPLLFAYSALKGKKGIGSVIYLLIPIAALGVYQLYTQYMYGAGLLSDTASFAVEVGSKSQTGIIEKTFIGLVFAGGCILTPLFILLAPGGKRAVAAYITAAVAAALYVYSKGSIGASHIFNSGFKWTYLSHLSIFAATGLGIFALAIYDFAKRKDADSALLCLWTLGAFVFGAHVNWSINARALLPMAPPVAILIMRAAESRSGTARIYIPIALSFAISFIIAWADYRHADSARTVARTVSEKYSQDGREIWFRGHWGFQYYMESYGASPLVSGSEVGQGEYIVVPRNNTNTGKDDLWASLSLVEEINSGQGWPSVMNLDCESGFYSNEWGALPFVVRPGCRENYRVFLVPPVQ